VIRPNLIRPSNATASAKLLTLIAVVVVIAGLYFGRQVLIPLALAVVLAFLLSPVVSWLEKRRIARVPAVLAVLVLAFGLVGFGAWMVTGQLMNVLDQFPNYQSNIHYKIQSLRDRHGNRLTNATKTVSDLSNELSAASASAAGKKAAKQTGSTPIPVQVTQPATNAPQYLHDIVGPLTEILETAAIVIVFTMFILMQREDLRNRVIRLAGQNRLTVVTQALDDASRRLSRYLFLQFLVNAIYGLLFGGATFFIGVPHPLLWGVLAFLLRFVPYIGTAITAAVSTLMALAVFPGWHHAALTLGVFITLELITSNVIEPWLYGAHTGISSLAILVSAVFWALLWGPIGLILSTPLTVCLILMGRYVPQLDFLEVLLGDEPVLPVEAHFYQRLLALDQDEATIIAENYLKEKPLGNLYDSVLLPALAMAEQDRHLNTLDKGTADFISQTTRELIEEVGERFFDSWRTPTTTTNDQSRSSPAVLFSRDNEGPDGKKDDGKKDDKAAIEIDDEYSALSGLRVVCIPARDEADELVSLMLAQLLRALGSEVRVLPLGSPASAGADVGADLYDVAVISALPPFAAGHARALCKRLRQKQLHLKILLGFWTFEAGAAKAQDRVGGGCADMAAISLQEAIAQMALASQSLKLPEHAREQSPV
jgi:predicted PurR-regulated permease PerM